MYKSNQFGRSMVEMLGALGIIAMVGSGLIGIISNVMGKYKQNMAVVQLQDLQKGIRSLYSADDNYDGLQISNLIKEKVVPFNMIRGQEIYNAYGSKVEIFGSDSSYRIIYNNLNKNACVYLLQINWSINSSSNLQAILINSTLYDWSGKKVKKLPISVEEAYNVCNNNAQPNDITWIFQ